MYFKILFFIRETKIELQLYLNHYVIKILISNIGSVDNSVGLVFALK